MTEETKKEDQIANMNLCAIWLIKNLCLDTNADEATITQKNVHGPDGNVFGDYEIVIRKIESPTNLNQTNV